MSSESGFGILEALLLSGNISADTYLFWSVWVPVGIMAAIVGGATVAVLGNEFLEWKDRRNAKRRQRK